MFEEDFIQRFEKYELVKSYLDNQTETYNNLLIKYPEFNKIDMFIKIAEEVYNHFINHKYCTFTVNEDNFFSLIDCTFKGYSDDIYITSENEDIYLYPYLTYDHSCMLYIEIPEDFDDSPNKYKDEFIKDAILTVAENYIIVSKEDEEGLTGKTIKNPKYIEE